jgi:ribosomal RNA-processing protein 1
MSSDEQIFARSLVHPEKPIRDKTIKELQKYLRSLTEITDLDMLKLWKALFYCLWLTDQSHIQMELSQTLANLMDSLVPKKITSAASQSPSLLFDKYLRMFYQILFHEWHHLDQYRLNKFYTLIRLMIRKSFQILYQLNYPSGLTQDFLRILTTEVLDKHPNGPRYHLCDIYLPELFIATNGGDITTENFVTLIRPFFSGLGLATDSSFYSRISEKIFGDYHRIYAREHARDAHPLHPENGHSLIQHEVVDGHISTPSTEAIPCFKYVSSVKIQMILFDIASSDPTAEPLMCTEGSVRLLLSLIRLTEL